MGEKPYHEAYTEAALEELLNIEAYLEAQREGLSEGFRREVDSTIDFLLTFPEAAPVIHPKGARRAYLERFPYGIVYLLKEDLLLVIAISHNKRAPNYWEDRLE